MNKNKGTITLIAFAAFFLTAVLFSVLHGQIALAEIKTLYMKEIYFFTAMLFAGLAMLATKSENKWGIHSHG